MAINELIAGGIKLPQFNLPDYGADLAQMAQIQNARNQNALAQYQLSAAQREDAATNALNAAYKDAYNTETGEIDLNKLRKSLSTGGFGSKLPALEKSISELKTQKLTQSKTETELIDSKLKQSRSFLDTVDPTDPNAPEQVIAWHEANHRDPVLGPLLASRGITAAQSRARIEQAIKQGPQAFAQLLAQSKLGIEKFMEQNAPKFFTQDVGGQTQLLSVPGLGGKSEVVPGSVMTKTLTPGESKENIRTVDTNDEVLTMAYDPVTGVDRIVSRQKKNLTPGEARPQPSTVDLGGTVATRVFDPATGTFNTVSTEQKTAAPSAPSPLAVLQAERDALIKKNPKDPLIAEYNARIKQITTHPSPSVTNVNVSTEKAYGGALASGLAKSDIEMRDAALSAPDAANNANKILEVLSKGNIIAGPGAEWKLKAAKLFNIVGKNNDELIANTEQLQKGLAAQTLDSIKTSGLGAGAGFTNADRDFLEKARSGNIEMTPETLRRTAELAHKSAQGTASKWNARVQQIPKSAIEGTGLSTEQISVPGLYGKPSAARGGGVDLNNPLLR